PGLRLRLVARDGAALARVADEARGKGAEAEWIALDVRDGAALAAQLLAWDDAAPFDAILANAGVTGGTAPDGSAESWASADRVIGVNLLGAVNTVAPLLPRMIARRAGRIGLVASVAAFRGLPDSPAYCASKAGLWSWGESLRAYLRPHGVGVTTIAPGFFRSDMSRRFSGRHPFELTLERAAARVLDALIRGQSRAIFPGVMGHGLRLLELLPAPLADRAVRLFRFHIAEG
ncbi:MAG: SDR family NAD(P)-dependent oxidoreductase, partial [Acetobacteraceae bacterium]|nr:SDR family NAD(P)-dependent oxidoreductase [Acetobacteraceae bacterium]